MKSTDVVENCTTVFFLSGDSLFSMLHAQVKIKIFYTYM